MLISRLSPRTKRLSTMEIPITEAQLAAYWEGGHHIQDVFPDLAPGEREFILTGYTPEDWAALMEEEE